MKTKISVPLLLCRILICILAICSVACFCLSMVDNRTTEDLTAEERDTLMSQNSFRYSVIALTKLELFAKDIEIEDVLYIKHLGLNIKTYSGKTTTKRMVCIGTKDSDKDLYIDFSFGCEQISEGEYTDLYNEYRRQGETVYSGLELKLIKETATADNVDEVLTEWRTEELESFKFVQRVLIRSFGLTEIKYITGISTVLLEHSSPVAPDIYVIKFDMESLSKTVYYYMPKSLEADAIETTEDMYYTYRVSPNSVEEVYTDEDVQMILEKMGGVQ